MSEQPVLGLVRDLCTVLATEGVNYCHWKSNAALGRSATGDNDLDLLVDRGSVQRFTEILWRLGFKEASLSPQSQVPGIRDFYGYDFEGHKLVHVHAHYQLVLGHDATKNYCLPIEQPYLASSVQGEIFRVPAPEFEFVVFVIRMTLKHLTWDAVLRGQGNLSGKERYELGYLLARINTAEVHRILAQHLRYVDRAVFEACLRALEPGCSRWARMKAGGQLQRNLEACARRPAVADAWLKLWRQLVWSARRFTGWHAPRRHLAAGGLLIAIVGGDGAGKSTQIEELNRWLSDRFEIAKLHLGKPDWSALTLAVRGVLKIGRALGFYGFSDLKEEPAPERRSSDAARLPPMLRAVCTARDRYLAYTRARRLADNGGLVICDRYPLLGMTAMDGPQVRRYTGNRRDKWLINLLVALEERYYRRIALPGLLVVLRADPDICVARKTDEEAASVRARSSQVWAYDWQHTPAHVIDAGRPQAEVFAELQALVWSKL